MILSRVRERSIHQALKLCRDKESQGFECIKPLEKVGASRKDFKYKNGRYEFKDNDYQTYWVAVYKKG